MEQKHSRIITATILVTIAVILGVIGMFCYGEQPLSASVEQDALVIGGMYGTSVPLSQIESVSLASQSVSVLFPHMVRINGYGGFGGTLRGHFRSETEGDFMLFAQKDAVPTLCIRTKDGEAIYLSDTDSEKISVLHRALQNALSD